MESPDGTPSKMGVVVSEGIIVTTFRQTLGSLTEILAASGPPSLTGIVLDTLSYNVYNLVYLTAKIFSLIYIKL